MSRARRWRSTDSRWRAARRVRFPMIGLPGGARPLGVEKTVGEHEPSLPYHSRGHSRIVADGRTGLSQSCPPGGHPCPHVGVSAGSILRALLPRTIQKGIRGTSRQRARCPCAPAALAAATRRERGPGCLYAARSLAAQTSPRPRRHCVRDNHFCQELVRMTAGHGLVTRRWKFAVQPLHARRRGPDRWRA